PVWWALIGIIARVDRGGLVVREFQFLLRTAGAERDAIRLYTRHLPSFDTTADTKSHGKWLLGRSDQRELLFAIQDHADEGNIGRQGGGVRCACNRWRAHANACGIEDGTVVYVGKGSSRRRLEPRKRRVILEGFCSRMDRGQRDFRQGRKQEIAE